MTEQRQGGRCGIFVTEHHSRLQSRACSRMEQSSLYWHAGQLEEDDCMNLDMREWDR